MPKLYLKTFGALSLHAEGPRGEVLLAEVKSLFLPAFLATLTEATAPVASVVAVLSPEAAGSSARRALSGGLTRLRKRIGVEPIRFEGDDLALDPSVIDVDLMAFERRMILGRYAEATEVLAGPLLGIMRAKASEDLRRWADAHYDRVLFDADTAFGDVIAKALESRDSTRTLRFAHQHVGLNPDSERARSRLVSCLLASGDDAGARGEYDDYRSRLRENLGHPSDSELDSITADIRSALGDV